MIIDAVIARLAAVELSPGQRWLRRCEGAAALSAVQPVQPSSLPAAFVLLGEERAAANRLVGAVHQDVTVSVVVLLVLSAIESGRSDRSPASEERALDRLVSALLGFEPTLTSVPITYGGARLAAIQNNQLWLQATFQTSRAVRAVG